MNSAFRCELTLAISASSNFQLPIFLVNWLKPGDHSGDKYEMMYFALRLLIVCSSI